MVCSDPCGGRGDKNLAGVRSREGLASIEARGSERTAATIHRRTPIELFKLRCQFGATRIRFHLSLGECCCVLLCAKLLTDRVIQSREGKVSYVRDVGAAGSNPFTQTIVFASHFSRIIDRSPLLSRHAFSLPSLFPSLRQLAG